MEHEFFCPKCDRKLITPFRSCDIAGFCTKCEVIYNVDYVKSVYDGEVCKPKAKAVGIGLRTWTCESCLPTPDRGLDLSERAPRIYDQRCTKCGGFMTSDPAYGCTPEKCADEPVPNPHPLRQNRWMKD